MRSNCNCTFGRNAPHSRRWEQNSFYSVQRRSTPACRSAAAAPQQSEGFKPRAGQQTKTAFQLALKEWSVACAALGDGSQTILLRKGGIAEKGFRPDALSFLLMPTSFHVDAGVLLPEARDRYGEVLGYEPKALPSLELGVAAELTGAWTVTAPADPDAGGELLAATSGLHVYGPQFLQARLKWRPRQPLTLLELRARRLRPPLALPARDDFWGCFSWVDVGARAAAEAAERWQHSPPALPDREFAERQAALRRALRGMEAEPLGKR